MPAFYSQLSPHTALNAKWTSEQAVKKKADHGFLPVSECPPAPHRHNVPLYHQPCWQQQLRGHHTLPLYVPAVWQGLEPQAPLRGPHGIHAQRGGHEEAMPDVWEDVWAAGHTEATY